MYRIKEEINGGAPNDLTKCIAYKACKKTPDWSNEAPTEAPTEAPVPDCCDTITQEDAAGNAIVWTKTAEVNEGYPVYTSGDLFMWWMWHGPEGHWVVNKTPGAHGGDVVKSEFDLDMCPDKVANWQDGSTFQCGSPTVATTAAPPAQGCEMDCEKLRICEIANCDWEKNAISQLTKLIFLSAGRNPNITQFDFLVGRNCEIAKICEIDEKNYFLI